jgi:hypothetical protein
MFNLVGFVVFCLTDSFVVVNCKFRWWGEQFSRWGLAKRTFPSAPPEQFPLQGVKSCRFHAAPALLHRGTMFLIRSGLGQCMTLQLRTIRPSSQVTFFVTVDSDRAASPFFAK